MKLLMENWRKFLHEEQGPPSDLEKKIAAWEEKNDIQMKKMTAQIAAKDKEFAAQMAAKDKQADEEIAKKYKQLANMNSQSALQFKQMMAQMQAQVNQQLTQTLTQTADVDAAAAQAQQVFQQEFQKIDAVAQKLTQGAPKVGSQETGDPACPPGAKFSAATGEPCKPEAEESGCHPGAVFNAATGERC
jgi:hypothetical protein|tara:strand:- start:57 stop:623 length:567 start_codon:yes stop_codon:yes gene_type:complete